MIETPDHLQSVTGWRYFADHRQRTTWSFRVDSHPAITPKVGVVEITAIEQADLRFKQGYEFRAYP